MMSITYINIIKVDFNSVHAVQAFYLAVNLKNCWVLQNLIFF